MENHDTKTQIAILHHDNKQIRENHQELRSKVACVEADFQAQHTLTIEICEKKISDCGTKIDKVQEKLEEKIGAESKEIRESFKEKFNEQKEDVKWTVGTYCTIATLLINIIGIIIHSGTQ